VEILFKKDVIYRLIYGMDIDKLALQEAYSKKGVFWDDRDTVQMDQGFSVSHKGIIQFSFLSVLADFSEFVICKC